jgi:D-threo-aldose 1-dehydrogenase
MSQESPLTLRPLGQTSLRVTPLCVGSAPLGDMPDTFGYGVTEEQAMATLRTVFTSPINFLDTANNYGQGESERRIGLALRELGGLPPGYVLASKADRDMTTGDFSGSRMRRSIEESLARLGLERLQLCYLHDPENTTFEEAMAPGGAVETLLQCQREGLIEHLGVAGGPIDLMIRFVETGHFTAAISHNRYTLLNTEADPFWDVCQRYGVAVLNAAPYGSGLLAKGPAAYPRYMYGDAPRELLERAERIAAHCQVYNVPLAAAALQFSLRDPRIVSTIVGLSKPERVAETIALASYPIPEELWEKLAPEIALARPGAS